MAKYLKFNNSLKYFVDMLQTFLQHAITSIWFPGFACSHMNAAACFAADKERRKSKLCFEGCSCHFQMHKSRRFTRNQIDLALIRLCMNFYWCITHISSTLSSSLQIFSCCTFFSMQWSWLRLNWDSEQKTRTPMSKKRAKICHRNFCNDLLIAGVLKMVIVLRCQPVMQARAC